MACVISDDNEVHVQESNEASEIQEKPSHATTSVNNDRTGETGPSLPSSEKVSADNLMSKRKRKRMLKHEEWLKNKTKKKLERKERIKKAKAEGKPVPKSRSSRRKGIKKMDCDEALPVNIVIDMSFEPFMDENSTKKLLKQVKACYAVNRKATKPVQLYLTSFGGKVKEISEEIYKEYKNWDIHIRSESYLDVFKKDDIVYLTSDSENILEDIELSKTYIVGGLVDHNHHKGLCHKIAGENQVSHAQLPIKSFVKLQSRTVLTVNHVFEIMLKYLETKDWQRAFYDVIPKRKGISLVDNDNEEEHEEQIRNNIAE